jgi:hypothetical protein
VGDRRTVDRAGKKTPAVVSKLHLEIDRCRADPVFFAEKWLGVRGLYDRSVEILESIRDNRRTCVAACHSSGKTFTASIACWWFAICFPPSIVVTTAPGELQVKRLLWGEIRARHGEARVALPGEPSTLFWQMPDPPGRPGMNAKWYMTGFSTRPDEAADHSSRFVGYHAPHVLVVFDEASGILRPIWKAAQGLMASGNLVRLLSIGNPLDGSSPFAEAYRSPTWHSIRISAFDTPNLQGRGKVHPHLVDQEFVDDMRSEEGEDSPLYVAKVLGLFPESGEDDLIPLGWVSRALSTPGPTVPVGGKGLGCDVARFGSDWITFYGTQGNEITFAEARKKKRTTWTARRLLEIAEDEMGLRPSEAWRIAVDDTGVGGGVTDYCWDHGWQVNAVDFGSNALADGKFADRRTELWWHLREWVEFAELAGAPERARRHLEGDLSTPKYDFDPKGRRILEPKKKMKKRLGRSPDDGDGLALSIAWRHSRHEGFPVDPEVYRTPRDPLDQDRETGVAPAREDAGNELERLLFRRSRLPGRKSIYDD